ncbi:hypothetical protein D3C76_1154770 [compost metagenome]
MAWPTQYRTTDLAPGDMAVGDGEDGALRLEQVMQDNFGVGAECMAEHFQRAVQYAKNQPSFAAQCAGNLHQGLRES